MSSAHGPIPSQVLDSALANLRRVLLATKPSGADGFEGLVADVLSDMTGLVIRLAKSGAQFGRDGSSPVDAFALALEGKRYDDGLRLEDLAGKAVVGGHVLAGRVDVWVLGATSEVGDDTLATLTAILEDRGVALLALDWAARPLPPLAVALAAARDATRRWFARHAAGSPTASTAGDAPAVDPAVLAGWLDAIAGAPAFAEQAARIRAALGTAHVGLDALRHRSAEWLRRRLTERGASQRSFGQYVTVADPTAPAVPRPALARRLAECAATAVAAGDRPRAVVVTGEEGAGKTWLVAQWWAALPTPPVLLLVAGRRADRLVPGDPTESLARLLAEQDVRPGARGGADVGGWRARLHRWAGHGAAGTLRFVVVLDGLNEHPARAWATLVQELAQEAHALGGLLVATCRPAFWRADVAPRLADRVEVAEVSVGGYTDEELTAVLARASVAPSTLSPRVREFVRTPRVCAVAVGLLDRLALQPDELTVDRLLLEYWHARLAERGDLVGHGVTDFHKLLRSHARAWLAQPRRAFDRDTWAQHSGAATRRGPAALLHDLTEIEEGRFLTPAGGDDGTYAFRPEALPFALALLLNAELRKAASGGARQRVTAAGRRAPDTPDTPDGSDEPSAGVDGRLAGVLDAVLDPVRGFDILADVLAAAVGLACLDEGFPEPGRRALIRGWLGLQNVGRDAADAVTVYLTLRPDTFLDVAETPGSPVVEGLSGRASGVPSLPRLIQARRDHPRVRAALDRRILTWLGRWSFPPADPDDDEASAHWRAGRDAGIAADLAAMSATERDVFARLTTRVARPAALNLARLAARLLAGRPLASYAAALWGWALARAVAPDLYDTSDTLAWVVRLNRVDGVVANEAARALMHDVGAASAAPIRYAAATLLRLLGDQASAERAESLSPLHPGTRWTRAEEFCDVDPRDPAAPSPTNLDRAREAAAHLNPDDVWTTMHTAPADHDLETATPGLARFDIDVLVDLHRRVIATAPERWYLGLRQLAWHLPGLSPLLGPAELDAIRAAYEHLLAGTRRVSPEDRDWVFLYLVAGLAPHLAAGAQLDLLLRLPDDCELYMSLRAVLKPLSSDALEHHLLNAHAAALGGRPQALGRVLFFAAAAAPPALTPAAVDVVARALDSADDVVAFGAADVAHAAADPALDDRVLTSALARTPRHGRWATPWGAALAQRALAAAVVRRRRADLAYLLSGAALDWAAQHLGSGTLDVLAADIQRTIERLLAPVRAVPPRCELTAVVATPHDPLLVHHYVASPYEADELADAGPEAGPDVSGEQTSTPLDEQSPSGDTAADAAGGLAASPDKHVKSDSETQARRHTQAYDARVAAFGAYAEALAAESAAAVLEPPGLLALPALVMTDPPRVARWLIAVLAADGRAARRVRNVGAALAGAYAAVDPHLAAQVLQHLAVVEPIVRVTIGPERVDLWSHVVLTARLTAPEGAPLAALRRRLFTDALDDAAIEHATSAAETCERADWLDGLVDELVASAHPGEQALGITVAGLRSASARSTCVLARGWGPGFLGDVARHAREVSRRAEWAAVWLERAAAAPDPVEFWRCATLAEGAADVRSLRVYGRLTPTGVAARFWGELLDRLRRAADERTRARGRTLFGLRGPDTDLVRVLRRVPARPPG